MLQVRLLLCTLLIVSTLELYSQESQDADSLFAAAQKQAASFDLDGAISNFSKAAALYEKTSDFKKSMDARLQITLAYLNSNQLEKAHQLIQENLTFVHKHLDNNFLYLVRVYNILGQINLSEDKIEAGIDNYAKAKNILDSVYRDTLDFKQAIIRNNIAIAYDNLGDFQKAVRLKKEAIVIIEKLGMINAVNGLFYNNLASSYEDLGEINTAIDLYNKELYLLGQNPQSNKLSEAKVLNNLGCVYHKAKDFGKSMYYLQQSYKYNINEAIIDSIALAQNCNNIASVFDELKNYDSAIYYKNRALDIYKKYLGDSSQLYAATLYNLGVSYGEMNDLEKAKGCLNKSARLYRHIFGERHFFLAKIYYNEAMMLYEHGSINEVFKKIQDAIIANCRSFSDNDIYSFPALDDIIEYNKMMEILAFKGQVLYEQGLLNNDNALLEAARFSFIHCDSIINLLKRRVTNKNDKLYLASLSHDAYKWAIETDYALFERTQKQEYKESVFQSIEKCKAGVLMEAMTVSKATKFGDIPDSLLAKEHDLAVNIAFYTKKLAQTENAKQISEIRNTIFTLNAEYNKLIHFFEIQFPKYYELKYLPSQTSVNQIQSLLDSNSVVWDFFISDSSIYVFCIDKYKSNIYRKPSDNFTLDLISILLNEISQGQSDNLKYINSLAKYISEIVCPDNMDYNWNNIIIIPDKELSMLPFEILFHSDMDKPLIEKFSISYMYSANLLLQNLKNQDINVLRKGDCNALIMAPVFSQANIKNIDNEARRSFSAMNFLEMDATQKKDTVFYIQALPATRDEAIEIADKFKSRNIKPNVLLYRQANEDYIQSASMHKYDFVHIATHGYVNISKPELSCLLLSPDSCVNHDGILYSGEIYNLQLNNDLTVLSACETGLGEIKTGEGLIGLTRAFLYAGSKNIVVSLWKVADNSTSLLMQDFYQRFLNTDTHTVSYSQALRNAKLQLMKNPKYQHPYYWCPFVLIGY